MEHNYSIHHRYHFNYIKRKKKKKHMKLNQFCCFLDNYIRTGKEFNENHYPTHGTSMKIIEYDYEGTQYKLKLRDTPGMEKYLQF